MKRKLTALTILALLLFMTLPSASKVFMKREEALNTAFPGAEVIEKKHVYLSKEQARKIEVLSKARIYSSLYVIYKATIGEKVLGYAVIDTHLLRTKTETVMYVIDSDVTLRHVEILAFFEPTDYMAGNSWLDLFKERGTRDSLKVGNDLPNITGATITANSFAQSTRKVLNVVRMALHNGQLN